MQTLQRRHLLATATAVSLALAGLGLSTTAAAQSTATIKIMVGFPPGGALDATARMVAEKMATELKQIVIVENKPGAGGRLAAELLKNAAPDGTTYMIAPLVIPVLAPLVFSKLNYNPATDFAPVGHVASFDFALTVHTNHPAKTVKELVAWYKANPTKANFGSPAAGSLPHFFGLLTGREAGVDVQHISYNGGAPLQTAVLGEQVPAGIDTVFEWKAQHQAGKLRIIGTSGNTRSKVLPDVATFKEQGYADITGQGWFGMYAPAKTAAGEIDRVNKALNKVLSMKDVSEKLLGFGFEAGGGSPADLLKLTEADIKRWAPIVKASGFKAD